MNKKEAIQKILKIARVYMNMSPTPKKLQELARMTLNEVRKNKRDFQRAAVEKLFQHKIENPFDYYYMHPDEIDYREHYGKCEITRVFKISVRRLNEMIANNDVRRILSYKYGVGGVQKRVYFYRDFFEKRFEKRQSK